MLSIISSGNRGCCSSTVPIREPPLVILPLSKQNISFDTITICTAGSGTLCKEIRPLYWPTHLTEFDKTTSWTPLISSKRYIMKGKCKVDSKLNYLSSIPWSPMGESRYSCTILDLGTRRRWVVSFTPRPLYPRESPPGTNWIGGRLGSKASLEAMEQRKLLLLPGIEPWP
jgi:hypothetical protein